MERLTAQAIEARDAAVAALLERQDPEGWWKGELETNVAIEAEDLLLRRFLGIEDAEITRLTANWIRSSQRSDGTWATFYEGPPDLSVTVEAYTALRLAGDPVDASHMAKAREFILDAGGLERSRVFTRLWLALFGEWRWEDLPALAPEVVLLPSWMPLNIYDFACWARQTIVPLTIVGTVRPARDLGFAIDEIRTGATPPEREPAPKRSWAGALKGLDAVLHRYHRIAPGVVRRRALATAEQWILDRQEADGCWGGIQPPWVYSIMALHLRGYAVDHPVLARAIAGFDRYTIVENDTRRIECCQSPVWDTALSVVALADADIAPDHPAMVRAADWLLDEEVGVAGDWAVRRPDLAPGGWAFEFDNDNYPDLDDTAEVVLALDRVSHNDPVRAAGAVRRGVAWAQGMQSRDGGYAAFDADNTRYLTEKLPFCDFGEVVDPPSADVTAHVVEMLCHEGGPSAGTVDAARLAAAIDWLLAHQEADGSWFGRWGANHLYGTGAVVPALVVAGLGPDHPAIAAAVTWLHEVQNHDGGWGEDLRSYTDDAWRGRGPSTASQTAWALLALLAAGDTGPATRRGVEWLVDNQRGDGNWDEPEFTGTGFPGDFYINYHLYRLTFPLTALGRYLRAVGVAAPPASTSS
ncbi:MAG: squalene--hopene cyclase [Acidimicrobiales bacterium]